MRDWSPTPGIQKSVDGKQDKAKYESAVRAVLAEKMSVAALKNYDAVIFANTTGDLPLPDPQGFIDWVASGKDLSASIRPQTRLTKPGTPPASARARKCSVREFQNAWPGVSVDAINQDKECAACRHLPASWTVFDEIYQMNSFNRATVHGLLSLDKHPNNKTPGDYPIAWIKQFGKGRVFYTSLGHREDVWEPNSKGTEGRDQELSGSRAGLSAACFGRHQSGPGLEGGCQTATAK